MKENQVEFLERQRKWIRFFYGLMIVVGVSGVILSIVIEIKYEIEFFSLGMMISVAVCVLFYLVFVNKKEKAYKGYFKREFVSSVIKGCVSDAVYVPNRGFSKDMVQESGLIQLGNIFRSEDYVKGTHNNVAFERSDMLIQQRTSNGKSSSTVTYLKGRWMIFESNKSFDADLQIVQKGYSYAKKKKSIFTKKEERRHIIQTEDEEFNKEFTCLCQNDAEAFYLLTPGVMQGIMKLEQELDGKLVIGFVHNQIHVIVHTNKDSFEPSIWRKIDFQKVAEAAQKEIHVITSFVEGLKLERKIFE